jgi:hypothetical protein
MCTELLPPGGSPIAVKYIIPYHLYITHLNNFEDSIFMSNNKLKYKRMKTSTPSFEEAQLCDIPLDILQGFA